MLDHLDRFSNLLFLIPALFHSDRAIKHASSDRTTHRSLAMKEVYNNSETQVGLNINIRYGTYNLRCTDPQDVQLRTQISVSALVPLPSDRCAPVPQHLQLMAPRHQ